MLGDAWNSFKTHGGQVSARPGPRRDNVTKWGQLKSIVKSLERGINNLGRDRAEIMSAGVKSL